MLLQLEIKNFAIIKEATVPFSDNLNVITGETGAGKSILLGAMSLILGVRADKGTLRDQNKKAVVEGTFSLPNQEIISTFFSIHELDYAQETIIRREINASGKSRAFINDTPVNLKILSAFGSLLVDLHQQFDTLQLGQANFQLHLLDVLAQHPKKLEGYRQQFQAYLTGKKTYEALKEKAAKTSKETDYHQFLLEELREAHFEENELEELDQELQIQSNAEELKQNLSDATASLSENEDAVVAQIRQAKSQLDNLSKYHKSLPDLIDRLTSAQIELQDIANELEQINEEIEFDEERISILQDRLNLGYRLLKKHQLQTTEELLELQSELTRKLTEIEDLDSELEQADQTQKAQYKKAKQLAEQLSKSRKEQIKPFIKKLEQLLQRVGMENARIRLTVKPKDLTEDGQDEIIFEFDANKSGHFLPLKKVASGGELSRLMLCIKSLMAHSATLPTLIFDEIESGVSGEAARQVGILLQELAASHQVICVSHQPQVAAKANTHFQVSKTEKNGTILSVIHQLSKEERIQIIAGMLSGHQPTEAALTNAKELMGEQV